MENYLKNYLKNNFCSYKFVINIGYIKTLNKKYKAMLRG